jgi:hypothetical protein
MSPTLTETRAAADAARIALNAARDAANRATGPEVVHVVERVLEAMAEWVRAENAHMDAVRALTDRI